MLKPEVDELDDVFLYTVDDLQEIIQENIESRQEAAEQAQEIIENQVEEFLNWERCTGFRRSDSRHPGNLLKHLQRSSTESPGTTGPG